MSSKLFQGVFWKSVEEESLAGPFKKKKMPVYTLANKLSHITNEITFFNVPRNSEMGGCRGKMLK